MAARGSWMGDRDYRPAAAAQVDPARPAWTWGPPRGRSAQQCIFFPRRAPPCEGGQCILVKPPPADASRWGGRVAVSAMPCVMTRNRRTVCQGSPEHKVIVHWRGWHPIEPPSQAKPGARAAAGQTLPSRGCAPRGCVRADGAAPRAPASRLALLRLCARSRRRLARLYLLRGGAAHPGLGRAHQPRYQRATSPPSCAPSVPPCGRWAGTDRVSTPCHGRRHRRGRPASPDSHPRGRRCVWWSDLPSPPRHAPPAGVAGAGLSL